jgi:quercetin dioxygenase-like cupin family protein
MARLVDIAQPSWRPIRPELTVGVSGKLLLDGPTKIVLTKVEPGGVFRPHRDSYGHLFHVLSGRGMVWVDSLEYPVVAGMMLRVEAGDLHGYENRGEEDLLLISVNLPAG